MASLTLQLEALEGAVTTLPGEQREVIQGIYFQRKNRGDICRKLFISENTLHRRRKKAIANLADILSIIF